jgi:hypothetical protein
MKINFQKALKLKVYKKSVANSLHGTKRQNTHIGHHQEVELLNWSYGDGIPTMKRIMLAQM